MSPEPGWLKRLTGCVCETLSPIANSAPIGCHYHPVGDTWEVSLFFSPTEIIGGEFDGQRIACLFVADVLELIHVFDVVEQMSWQPMPVDENDEVGAHLAVTGYFEGKRILFRVLATTPDQFAAGLFANLHERKFIDTWSSE